MGSCFYDIDQLPQIEKSQFIDGHGTIFLVKRVIGFASQNLDIQAIPSRG
jgi:hypothetical protein